MTGKRYYLTNLAAWQRHAARCVESHFIALDPLEPAPTDAPATASPGQGASVAGAAINPGQEGTSFTGADLAGATDAVGAAFSPAHDDSSHVHANADRGSSLGGASSSPALHSNLSPAAPASNAPILALIAADEAAHIALETDAEFEPLPHPLARTPVSERVVSALAHFGVASGDDTFTVAEKLARVNPLLRHRVF